MRQLRAVPPALCNRSRQWLYTQRAPSAQGMVKVSYGRQLKAISRAGSAPRLRHCTPAAASYTADPMTRVSDGVAFGEFHAEPATGITSTVAGPAQAAPGGTVTSSTQASLRQKSVVLLAQVDGAGPEQSLGHAVRVESGRPWGRANATMTLRKWLVSTLAVAWVKPVDRKRTDPTAGRSGRGGSRQNVLTVRVVVRKTLAISSSCRCIGVASPAGRSSR